MSWEDILQVEKGMFSDFADKVMPSRVEQRKKREHNQAMMDAWKLRDKARYGTSEDMFQEWLASNPDSYPDGSEIDEYHRHALKDGRHGQLNWMWGNRGGHDYVDRKLREMHPDPLEEWHQQANQQYAESQGFDNWDDYMQSFDVAKSDWFDIVKRRNFKLRPAPEPIPDPPSAEERSRMEASLNDDQKRKLAKLRAEEAARLKEEKRKANRAKLEEEARARRFDEKGKPRDLRGEAEKRYKEEQKKRRQEAELAAKKEKAKETRQRAYELVDSLDSKKPEEKPISPYFKETGETFEDLKEIVSQRRDAEDSRRSAEGHGTLEGHDETFEFFEQAEKDKEEAEARREEESSQADWRSQMQAEKDRKEAERAHSEEIARLEGGGTGWGTVDSARAFLQDRFGFGDKSGKAKERVEAGKKGDEEREWTQTPSTVKDKIKETEDRYKTSADFQNWYKDNKDDMLARNKKITQLDEAIDNATTEEERTTAQIARDNWVRDTYGGEDQSSPTYRGTTEQLDNRENLQALNQKRASIERQIQVEAAKPQQNRDDNLINRLQNELMHIGRTQFQPSFVDNSPLSNAKESMSQYGPRYHSADGKFVSPLGRQISGEQPKVGSTGNYSLQDWRKMLGFKNNPQNTPKMPSIRGTP